MSAMECRGDATTTSRGNDYASCRGRAAAWPSDRFARKPRGVVIVIGCIGNLSAGCRRFSVWTHDAARRHV